MNKTRLLVVICWLMGKVIQAYRIIKIIEELIVILKPLQLAFLAEII